MNILTDMQASPLTRPLTQVKQHIIKHTKRHAPGPLFNAILAWVLLAVLAFTLLGLVWGSGSFLERVSTNWHSVPAAETAPLETVKVSLTTIGGIGAVGYLVIKFRERSDAERSEADTKLLAAVQQLGSNSPQVRIAGVYALADVADTFRGEYRQRVADILCGYLRTNRDARSDGAVESTIISVLGKHLRKQTKKGASHSASSQAIEADQLWCDCTIDLHGATLTEQLKLHNTYIAGSASFRDAAFIGGTQFDSATFAAYADFSGATFHSESHFNGTIFEDGVSFSNTQFEGAVAFHGANIHGTLLSGLHPETLERITIREAISFHSATFNDQAVFDFATFFDNVDFDNVIFRQEVSFWSTHFEGDTYLNDTLFESDVSFFGTYFAGAVLFTNVRSHKTVHCDHACFTVFADFSSCDSEADFNFNGASFNSNLDVACFQFPESWTANTDTNLPAGARWESLKEFDNIG